MRNKQVSMLAHDRVWCRWSSSRAPALPARAVATDAITFCRAGVRRW